MLFPDQAIPDDPMICYHYCGLDKFVAIVRSKKLRLCNLFHMNDAKEVSWFFDIASKRIDDLLAGPEDGDDGSSSSSWQRNALGRLRSLITDQRFYHIYAACFSKEPDSLSQWRGYADDGRGVTLGIDIKELCQQASCRLLKPVEVIYNRAEAEQKVDEILGPLFDTNGSSSNSSSSSGSSSGPRPAIRIFRQLAKDALEYKNPAFQHEREVRLIVQTSVPAETELEPEKFDDRWFADFPSTVEFFAGQRGLVPFTKVELRGGAVREVGFGPKFGAWQNEAALRLFCGKRLPKSQIHFYNSAASYR